jgi:hypothetical protein
MPPKKVVYLFGAGATLAEWQYETGEKGDNLSLGSVSEAVINEAKGKTEFEELLSDIPTDGIRDIEHYISLLESVRTKKCFDLVEFLRSSFCKNIQNNLQFKGTPINPTLTEALLEMHSVIKDDEILTGAISLNYDNLLDRAFNEVYKGIDYGIECSCENGNYTIAEKTVPRAPIIKLHGSFNWKRGAHSIVIDEVQAQAAEQSEMVWIPPSVEKELDSYPYNLLWGNAFELLNCDVLRIIGCNLSQNDWGLISLLFNSQLKQGGDYKIELIRSQKGGLETKKNHGYLKNVDVLGDLENCEDLVDPDNPDISPDNVYYSWLRAKLGVHSGKGIQFGDLGLAHINQVMGERRNET